MVLTGQGTQVAPVAHGASHAGTGPCHQEMAMLEIQARLPVSPALGRGG